MIRLLLSLSLFFANGLIALEFSKGAPAAAVYFITPKNDDIVSGEVVVKFGLQNFGVSPAGLNVNGTGHHHLIIDADLPNLTQPIQADKNHVHFGKGQTEVKLELEPGLSYFATSARRLSAYSSQPTDLLKQNYYCC